MFILEAFKALDKVLYLQLNKVAIQVLIHFTV